MRTLWELARTKVSGETFVLTPAKTLEYVGREDTFKKKIESVGKLQETIQCRINYDNLVEDPHKYWDSTFERAALQKGTPTYFKSLTGNKESDTQYLARNVVAIEATFAVLQDLIYNNNSDESLALFGSDAQSDTVKGMLAYVECAKQASWLPVSYTHLTLPTKRIV